MAQATTLLPRFVEKIIRYADGRFMTAGYFSPLSGDMWQWIKAEIAFHCECDEWDVHEIQTDDGFAWITANGLIVAYTGSRRECAPALLQAAE
jgi:hypothetical protein